MNTSFPSLLHAVHQSLSDAPDSDAVVFNGARVTYRDLAARALVLSRYLKANGIKQGDIVAALITPRPEALVSMFGVWLAGATWAGINTRYKLREQRKILEDCNANFLIAVTTADNRDLHDDLKAHEDSGVRVLRVKSDLWAGELPEPPPQYPVLPDWGTAMDALDCDTPAVVIFTSGSTGYPKGALITHAGLAFRSHTMAQDRFGNVPIRLLLDLPVNHIGALASGVGLTLVSGGLMVMSEKFDPDFTLNAIACERLNVLIGVPAMMSRLAEHPRFAETDLTSLDFVCWGAGPLSEEVLDRLMKGCDAAFSQQYGMTESNGPIVYTPPTRDVEILLNTTGKPDARLEVRITDDNDNTVAALVEGEVQVRLPFPFAGYLNNADATNETVTADGFLRTGDRGLIREDGFLVFSGRSKEMFKSGGFNVYPREVEIVIESHSAVRAAAVIGRNDAAWGQSGVAFIELKHELEVADIAAWCEERLADYKIPKAFELMTALPRTPIDKVDKVALARSLGPTASET